MQERIPATIEEATSALNGIGALLTAKEWHRAAIVYAFTEPGNGQGRREPRTTSFARLSIRAFTELRIAGLTAQQTVAAYRKAWESAIADGSPEVKPGDSFELPSIPWKEVFGEPTTEVQARVFRSVVRNPQQFREALHDNPETAAVLAHRVMDHPATRMAVEARMAQPITPHDYTPAPPHTADYSAELTRGVNLLVPVLRAIQRGHWHPSTSELMLLHALGLLLDQASQADAQPHDDLFSDIERYLKEGVA